MTVTRKASLGHGAWALASAVLGGLLAAVPWWLFPVCGVGPGFALGGGHHGCHATLWVVTGASAAVVGLGLVALLVRHPLALRSALIVDALAGLIVIVAAAAYPGLCKLATMACREGTEPALVGEAFALLLLGAVGLWRRDRRS